MNMTTPKIQKGPATYRILILFLNITLALLIYWLLGFILKDISNQPGPSWQKIQTANQDPVLVKQNTELLKQQSDLFQKESQLQKKQHLLKDSISSFRDTMNQLLDLQKNKNFSEKTQQNLSTATQLYLENQQQFQLVTNSLSETSDQLQQIQNQLMTVNLKLNEQTQLANQQYNAELLKHNLKLASLKLMVLIPLLLITAYFFKKYRRSVYISMISAIGIAIILKIIMVMHEHFASEFFKYILIVLLIVLVARALQNLLRMLVSPKASWLQKRYREAYKKLECAICDYPVQPLDREMKEIAQYACPSCGTKLLEKCNQCQHVRHSLLGFCEYCGRQK